MPELNEDRERHLVPRWNDFARAGRDGELSSCKRETPLKFELQDLEYVLTEWRQFGTVTTACELVSVAYSVGLRGAAEDAASMLLGMPEAPPLARRLAEKCLASEDPGPNSDFLFIYGLHRHRIKASIQAAKSRLRRYPKNPILWTNISLMYTTIGQAKKAEQSMAIALGLAPNNRFVLRSASRLYLHNEDVDRAHHVLAKSASVKSDPWIIAAEIAVSGAARKASISHKRGASILDSQDFSPFHLSELAGSLATAEAWSGNLRKARKLCTRSLEEPSENAVAQAAWLDRNVGGFLKRFPHVIVKSNEANAWTSQSNQQWETALQSAQTWQLEQPFSSRPAIFAGYLASTAFEDYEVAEQSLELGFQSNRTDVTLLNNLAFALANQGKLGRALETLDRADALSPTRKQKLVLMATRGLVAYRSGDVASGRLLYTGAIGACSFDDQGLAAVASLYFALEEKRVNSPDARKRMAEAAAKLQSLSEPHRALFLEKISRNSGELIPQ